LVDKLVEDYAFDKRNDQQDKDDNHTPYMDPSHQAFTEGSSSMSTTPRVEGLNEVCIHLKDCVVIGWVSHQLTPVLLLNTLLCMLI